MENTGEHARTELRARVRETNERSRKGWETAGLRPRVSASPIGCVECVALENARRAAVAEGGERAIEDATIAVRSHFRDAHLLPTRRS